jgi:hypothetical protein
MNSAELDLIASLVYMTDRRTMLYARRENSYAASPVPIATGVAQTLNKWGYW